MPNPLTTEPIQALETDPLSTPTRRHVIAAGAVVAGSVALIGCAGSGGGTATTSGAAQSAGTTPSAAGSTPAAAGGGSTAVIKLADVPVGGCASAQASGKPAMVSQPTAGKVVAFTAICTHMGCTVGPAGKEFHCPCHGSVYDAFTGKVISGPAPAALASIPVKLSGADVVPA